MYLLHHSIQSNCRGNHNQQVYPHLLRAIQRYGDYSIEQPCIVFYKIKKNRGKHRYGLYNSKSVYLMINFIPCKKYWVSAAYLSNPRIQKNLQNGMSSFWGFNLEILHMSVLNPMQIVKAIPGKP